MKYSISAMVGLVGAAAIMSPAIGQNAAGLYKGKTITMTMGTRPGGSFQVYGRLFSQYMPKHIPGNPTIVPAFMPGAGGTKAANYLYAAAAKDGNQMLLSHALPLAQMLKPKGLKFKSEKFQWLGSFSAITQLLTTWHSSPIKSLADAKSKQGVMSAFAKNHLTYQYVSMANNILGTKFKIIVGYRGGARNNQAMEQGETHGWVFMASSGCRKSPTCPPSLSWRPRKTKRSSNSCSTVRPSRGRWPSRQVCRPPRSQPCGPPSARPWLIPDSSARRRSGRC
jgi:hypothetical protein